MVAFWIFLSHSSFFPSAKWDDNGVSFTGELEQAHDVKYLALCLGQGMCSVHTSMFVVIINYQLFQRGQDNYAHIMDEKTEAQRADGW